MSSLIVGHVLPSGVDTRFGSAPRPLSSRVRVSPAKAKIEKGLFVSDDGENVFELKNKTYEEVGDITSGLNGADGLWVDKRGNVYVANITGPNVTEYKKGKGSPICTYSGINDPVNVTADNAGNVYVVDFNVNHDPGYIDVFPQCVNEMKKQYNIYREPEGVAVDKAGDIFVSYTGYTSGQFEEFKSGSSSPTVLGATITSPGGLVLDKYRNLIADDQSGNIDVIAPPYKSAKVLVSGLQGPFHCSLNEKEDLLFNANWGSNTVTVYTYPSGSLVTTIDASDGIDGADGVAESPDAVF